MTEFCDNCKNESRISALEKYMEANGSTHRDIYTKLEALKESVIRNEEKYNNILSLMTEIRCDIADLKGKSGKRWDSLIAAIITAIIASAVSIVATVTFLAK